MHQPDPNQAPAPVENDRWSGRRLAGLGLMVVTAVGIFLCYRLAIPCLPALVWAGALALVFAPLHRRIEAKISRANLATAVSLFITGFLVVVPATWIVQRLAVEAASRAESVQQKIASGKWRAVGAEHPRLASVMRWVERQVDLPQTAGTATTWLTNAASSLVKESVVAVIQLCLTLYFLFYLLRDRAAALRTIKSLLPLSEAECDYLFLRVADTIHATIYGMLGVSALQGVLGGLMYWWLGVPAPWLWALVMALFAFVPVVGTFVVWIPAAIYLSLEGSWSEALVLAAIGTFFVRAIVNVLYPILVKNRLHLHPVPIFVALIGGLILFGLSGLILGPAVLSITACLLEIWRNRTVGVQTSETRSKATPPPIKGRPA